VRVVELIDTGSSDNWDAHGDMENHRGKARRVDQAIAALIRDLKQRGLLEETLLACCTEFGRTPWGATPQDKGRNHHAKAFSCFLAGAGVRGGMGYGKTDDHGIGIVAQPCHVHDFHATILHLMGIDHKRLTYRYAGRDFRLTDVHGNVLHPILA
jgi:arylsulfatase A-like enzyme